MVFVQHRIFAFTYSLLRGSLLGLSGSSLGLWTDLPQRTHAGEVGSSHDQHELLVNFPKHAHHRLANVFHCFGLAKALLNVL